MNTGLLLGFLNGIGDYVENMLGGLIYNLCTIIFYILDILQGLFRSLVGLGMKPADEAQYDLVFKLIQTDTAVDIFLSMLISGIVLLFVFTFLAIIRNLYQEKQKPVLEFIKLGFKGLSGFLFVPITVVIGLAFSNVMIIIIDNATSGGTTHKISGTLFQASTYNSNELRNTTGSRASALENIINWSDFEKHAGVQKIIGDANSKSEIEGLALTDANWETLASLLDECTIQGCHRITMFTSNQVSVAYNLFEINYLILIIGGFSLIGILFKIAWGVGGRLINCLIGFITIPIVLSLYPLDEGGAYGSWKSFFIKNVTMGYTTIGILNIYYSVMPILNDFNFGYDGFAGGIIKTLVTVAALGATSSFISTFTGWLGKLGLGDAIAEGDKTKKAATDAWKSVTDKAGKAISTVGTGIGAYVGTKEALKDVHGAKKFGMAVGTFADAMGMTKGIDKFGIGKSMADGTKAAKESGKKYRTGTRWVGNVESEYSKKKLEADAVNEELSSLEKKIQDINSSDMSDDSKNKAIARYKKAAVKKLREGNFKYLGDILMGDLQKIFKDLERQEAELDENKEAYDKAKADIDVIRSAKRGLQTIEDRKNYLLSVAGSYGITGVETLSGSDLTTEIRSKWTGLSADQQSEIGKYMSKYEEAIQDNDIDYEEIGRALHARGQLYRKADDGTYSEFGQLGDGEFYGEVAKKYVTEMLTDDDFTFKLNGEDVKVWKNLGENISALSKAVLDSSAQVKETMGHATEAIGNGQRAIVQHERNNREKK